MARTISNAELAGSIQDGETVQQYIRRRNMAGPRCAGYCDVKTLRDARPATPGRIRAACRRMAETGYAGRMVAQEILCDDMPPSTPEIAEVAASVGSIMRARGR